MTPSVPLPRSRYWEILKTNITPLLSSRASISCVLCIFVFPPKAGTVPCPQSVLEGRWFGEWVQVWKGGPWDEEPRVRPLSSQATWPHNQWLDTVFPSRGIRWLPFHLFKANRPFWEACQTIHLGCPFMRGKITRRPRRKIEKGLKYTSRGSLLF